MIMVRKIRGAVGEDSSRAIDHHTAFCLNVYLDIKQYGRWFFVL